MGQPDFCVDTEKIDVELIRRVRRPEDVYVHRYFKRRGKYLKYAHDKMFLPLVGLVFRLIVISSYSNQLYNISS